MPRIRTIKPEFPQSESMGRVSRDARLLFIQMWTLADDSGRLRGNSRMLASLLFPYDDDAPDLINTWLRELEKVKCIVRYSDADGSNYVAVCNWKSHQKIDKPTESKLPSPDSCTPREDSRILSNPLESSSLDQGPRTKDQDQGKGEEVESKPLARTVARELDFPEELDTEDFRNAWALWRSKQRHNNARDIDPWAEQVTLTDLARYGPEEATAIVRFSVGRTNCKNLILDGSHKQAAATSSGSRIKDIFGDE